jgi:DNA-binding response OmpR family regulator
MKILIADDEPHITHMLRFLFEKRGHDVVIAEDGETALHKVVQEQPAVVFLDVNMPGKSGFEVCEALRAQQAYRGIPIYLLTAQGRDTDREKGLAVGATDYITKPFAPSRLVAIVASLNPEATSAEAERSVGDMEHW